MQIRWLVIASAVIGVIAIDPALAGPRKAKPAKTAKPVCIDQPYQFSFDRLFFGTKPEPNYCSPPVFEYGQYIGQDPDPNIRAYLSKDPATGYSSDFY